MSSRVNEPSTREAPSLSSSPSESESSFVSAASENTYGRSNQDSQTGKLAAAPRHSAFVPAKFQASDPTYDLTATKETPSTSSSPSPTPLAPHSATPQPASYFAYQPGVSHNEALSPQNKRPPASRSSHGIETSLGPPPALTTRRSYNAELPWRSPPSDQRATSPSTEHSVGIGSDVGQAHQIADDPVQAQNPGGPHPVQTRKLPIIDGKLVEMNWRHEDQSGSEEDQDPTLRVNGHRAINEKHTRKESGQQPSQSSQEDLFFNLAQADSVIDDRPEPSNNSETKPSRIRGSSLQQPRDSRPSSSHRPSTSVGGFGQRVSPMQYGRYESSLHSSVHDSPEKNSLPSLRDSPAKRRSYAATAHPLDQRKRLGNTRTSFGRLAHDGTAQDRSTELPLSSVNRRSIPQSSLGLVASGYGQSNSTCASNGDHVTSYFSGRQGQGGGENEEAVQTPHAEGTESTISTTAPSTVWDELEDMKSRIRKLEISGRLPASSNAAMSQTFRERPRTATTTTTTNSNSPNRRHMSSVSPEASTARAPELANVHPLLHAALAKTKPAINVNLYKVLEATASDALMLAVMAGNPSAQGVSPSTASIAGNSTRIEGRFRRRVDNMCRSLTELCMALSEETHETDIAMDKFRPTSNDANMALQPNESTWQDPRSFRATSDEPQHRSSSQVMSRLEARRRSLALGSSPLSRRDPPQEAPTQAEIPGLNRVDRTSSVIRSRASVDDGETASIRRPLSRTSTEIGPMKYSLQTKTSREYTSQYPMPKPAERSPSVQSSLPTRNTYFTHASHSPITPNVQLGSRRYFERSTPPSSADSSRLAEARQRRIASLSKYTSAG